MHTRMIRALIALAVITAAAPAAGQSQAIDAKLRTAVIDSIALRLERQYIDLDTARMIGAALRAQLKAGVYDTLTTPARFAEVVTRHMRTVNGDKHLSLQAQGGAPG